jgi:hypothetical protein
MGSTLRIPKGLLLQWLMFVGCLLIIGVVLWDLGLLAQLLENDPSYISALITFVALVACGHVGLRVVLLSSEFDAVGRIRERLAQAGATSLQVSDDTVRLAGDLLPPGLLREHATNLARRCSVQGCGVNLIGEQAQLLTALETRVKGAHGFGFLVADLMLKLGLLGTVVGFILMLGSLVSLDGVDLNVMQGLMIEMSGGMRVALYTTLTGLTAGILLSVQYHYLDWASDQLIADITDISEVYVIPGLAARLVESN